MPIDFEEDTLTIKEHGDWTLFRSWFRLLRTTKRSYQKIMKEFYLVGLE